MLIDATKTVLQRCQDVYTYLLALQVQDLQARAWCYSELERFICELELTELQPPESCDEAQVLKVITAAVDTVLQDSK